MQAPLDSAFRRGDCLRHFCLAHPQVVAHDNHRPLLGAELPHLLPEELCQLGLLNLLFRAGRLDGPLEPTFSSLEVGQRNRAFLVRNGLEGSIHHRPQEPRLEGTLAVEAVNRTRQPSKSVLHDILGKGALASNQEGGAQGLELMAFHQPSQPLWIDLASRPIACFSSIHLSRSRSTSMPSSTTRPSRKRLALGIRPLHASIPSPLQPTGSIGPNGHPRQPQQELGLFPGRFPGVSHKWLRNRTAGKSARMHRGSGTSGPPSRERCQIHEAPAETAGPSGHPLPSRTPETLRAREPIWPAARAAGRPTRHRKRNTISLRVKVEPFELNRVPFGCGLDPLPQSAPRKPESFRPATGSMRPAQHTR